MADQSISLTSSDLASRIRRFLNARGQLSPSLDQQLKGTLNMGDISRDPYQDEWRTYAYSVTLSAVAAQFGFGGIVGLAPATVIDAVTLTPSVAGTFQLLVQRPETSGLGIAFTAGTGATFNGGGKGSGLIVNPRAQALQGTSVGPSGQTVDFITIDTVRTVIYPLPQPIVLYGPPFNGQGATSGIGDAFLAVFQTANTAVTRISLIFREFTQFQQVL